MERMTILILRSELIHFFFGVFYLLVFEIITMMLYILTSTTLHFSFLQDIRVSRGIHRIHHHDKNCKSGERLNDQLRRQ